MARRRIPDMTLQAQLVAVRRAASNAALAVDRTDTVGRRRKAETHRDALAQAAATLQAVRDSAEALTIFPQAQREALAIKLAAGGYRAVLQTETASADQLEALDKAIGRELAYG